MNLDEQWKRVSLKVVIIIIIVGTSLIIVVGMLNMPLWWVHIDAAHHSFMMTVWAWNAPSHHVFLYEVKNFGYAQITKDLSPVSKDSYISILRVFEYPLYETGKTFLVVLVTKEHAKYFSANIGISEMEKNTEYIIRQKIIRY
ncbi:MAG: hypothetical protein JW725_00485 [Candidatus Babeliaceae bacterium]|nr:hypothetical protein [Candidatus Babeliaceae bacterium]